MHPRSGAQPVRLPVLHLLLDVVALGEAPVEDVSYECRQFGVAREFQPFQIRSSARLDQALPFSFTSLRAPRGFQLFVGRSSDTYFVAELSEF